MHISMLSCREKVKVTQKNNRLRIPLGGDVVMGPFRSKNIIPPSRVQGTRIKRVLPLGQLSQILHAVTIGVEGRIIIQLYNYSIVAGS